MSTTTLTDFSYDNKYFTCLEDHWSTVSFPTISILLERQLCYAESKIKISNILDLGCGNGIYSEVLGKHGDHVFGADISEIAVNRCIAKNTYTDVYKCDVTEGLPFETDFFEIIFCTEVIEHIENLDLLFNELNRILKRGGFLILTTTMYFNSIDCYSKRESGHSFFQMLKVRLDYLLGFLSETNQRKFILDHCFEKLGGHYHGFHTRQLTEILSKNGFGDINYNYFYVVEPFKFPFHFENFKTLRRKAFPKNILAPILFIGISIMNKVFKFLGIGANNIFIIAQKAAG